MAKVILHPDVLAKIAALRRLKALSPATSQHLAANAALTVTALPHSVPPATLTRTALASALTNENSVELENGQVIDLNSDQQKAIELALRKVTFCLTGAAGTGKTTTTKALVQRLVATGNAGKLATATRFIAAGTTGIFFLAYTKAAVRNLRKSVPSTFKANCFTIHKFVEMAPEEELYETADGEQKSRMVYKPRRNKTSPFPSGITTIVIDESSMVGEDHYNWLRDAIPYNFQVIFLGDINQLPTVANFSIFPQMLTRLPVVELKTIYRQALDSPIIPFAHKIKNGEQITNAKILAHPELYKCDALSIFRYPRPINDPMMASQFAGKVVEKWYYEGNYNPLTDIILVPWEKHFGWRDINAHIATFLDAEARSNGTPKTVYEVIANIDKSYFAVGDKVLYDKNPAVITKINHNALYFGNRVQPESTTLTRWGLRLSNNETADQKAQRELSENEAGFDFDALDDIDALADLAFDKDAVTRQASHTIHILYEDGDTEILSTSGEVNALSLGYATTVHKSQGSQWPRVIFLTHKSHNISLNRELLYTAMTRAEKHLTILCELDTFERGVKRQAIKGNSVEEKIEWYREKLRMRDEERQKKEELTGIPQSEFQAANNVGINSLIQARLKKFD